MTVASTTMEPTAEKIGLPGRLWLTALGICIVALAAEFLPVVFGAGEAATWDWGFLYVTLHFIALPVAFALHVAAAVILAAVLMLRTRAKPAAVALFAGLPGLAYLLILWLYPLACFVEPD